MWVVEMFLDLRKKCLCFREFKVEERISNEENVVGDKRLVRLNFVRWEDDVRWYN